MPQTPINKEYNTFVKGFITEASPFTFPANASLAEDNFDLNIKGYRSRRRGIDYENSFSLINTSRNSLELTSSAFSSFLWEDVNTKGELSILVVQVGSRLFFFDANKQPISGAILNQGDALELESSDEVVFQAASISGNLMVVNGTDRVYQLVYDEEEDRVNFLAHGLLVRDIWGISDNFDIDYRHRTSGSDTDIDDERLYNLGNNGWNGPSPRRNDEDDNATYRVDFAIDYNSRYGLQRNPNLIDKVVEGIDTSNENEFNGDFILNNTSSTTPSPKGSHIIDLLRRGDSRIYAYYRKNILDNYGAVVSWQDEDVDGNKHLGVFEHASGLVPPSTFVANSVRLRLKRDLTSEGATCVASYAGRVFYAGFGSAITDGDIKSPALGTYIAFSQVVTNPEKVGKCFQEGDPTSLSDFDLVESDGGTIKIPGVARVLKLVPIGRSLVVVASNGVWEIRGGEGSFSATDITVEKVSDIGAVNAESVVVAENSVFYWSTGGIYNIQREKTGLTLVYSNITSDTIQTYFNNIGSTQKQKAKGVYSEASKTITWLYNDEDGYSSLEDPYKFNRQLHLNLILGSFYTYTVPISSTDTEYPRVADIFISPSFVSAAYEDPVTVGGDQVQVSTDDVVISRSNLSNVLSEVSYLAVKPSDSGDWSFTIAVLNNPDFEDWGKDASEGIDSEAYLEAGHELVIDEDTQRRKQIQYLTTHLQRTEDGFDSDLFAESQSSCLMSVSWDFSSSSNSGKEGTEQQVYRLNRNYTPSGTGDSFDYGQSVISTKSRVRGRGRALKIKFRTEQGKNCILYGWGALYAANTNV